MENLIYFVRYGNNFKKIEENNFPKLGGNYCSVGGFPILEKDYNILFKFFNRHSLYLEDLNDKHFELSGNRVEKIILEHIVCNFPQELFGLDNLKYLDLSGGTIKTIPKKISKLRNLEKLYLDECSLVTIPYELTELPNLEVVSLMENNIKSKNAWDIVNRLQNMGIEVLI
jgi:Leucine-rich repeat (LRR) protein